MQKEFTFLATCFKLLASFASSDEQAIETSRSDKQMSCHAPILPFEEDLRDMVMA